MNEPENDPIPDDPIPEDLLDEAVAQTAESQPEEPDATPEPKEEEKPATEAPEPEKEPSEEPEKVEEAPKIKSEEEIEAELEAIQPSKHAHQGTKDGFKALKTKIKEEAAAARKVAQEKAELEQRLAEREKQPLPEEVATELQTLREFKRIRDIENDPIFKSKFDDRIAQLSTESLGMLEKWNLPEKTKEYITKKGGLLAIKTSTEKLADGSTVADWFKDNILEALPPKDREDFEDNLTEARQLERQKIREIEDVKKDGTKWEQKQKEDQEAKAKDWEAKAAKIRDKAVLEMGSMAQHWEPKPEATEEEKEYATWHNKEVDKAVKLYGETVQRLGRDGDPEIAIPTALAAAQTGYLASLVDRQRKQIEGIEKELEEANQKLGKIKNSGRTAKQTNAAPVDASKPKPVDIFESDSAAADRIFAAMDAGK